MKECVAHSNRNSICRVKVILRGQPSNKVPNVPIRAKTVLCKALFFKEFRYSIDIDEMYVTHKRTRLLAVWSVSRCLIQIAFLFGFGRETCCKYLTKYIEKIQFIFVADLKKKVDRFLAIFFKVPMIRKKNNQTSQMSQLHNL